MKIINTKNYWKYLFWLGPFLVAAGLTSGIISQKWDTISATLLIVGILIIGLWLILVFKQNNLWGRRSTQASTNALIATVAILVILGLINFLGVRYDLQRDLTETHLFSLAPQTKELLHSLRTPVKVWVFDVNQNSEDRSLLQDYRHQSSNFKYEYVDPQARPGLADKFGAKEKGEVYLESGNKRQLVQTINDNEHLSEEKLTNRLQQILSSVTPKVYFLQGHGEHQLTDSKDAISQAIEALRDKNFTPEPLDLTEKSSIPDNPAVVILVGPKRSLLDNEVKLLQDYLNGGGNLLLMLDPNTDPKLDNILNEWGIKLDKNIVVDVAGIEAFGPAVPIITEYGKHPITKDFGNGISFYPLARAIYITPVTGIEATPLLLTKPYPKSWAESDQNSEKLVFHEGKDIKGPLNLGVALTRKVSATAISTVTTSPTPTTSPTKSPTPTTSTTKSPTPTTSTTPTTSPTKSPTPTTSPTPTATTSPTSSSPSSPSPPSPPSSNQTSKESRMVVIGNSEFIANDVFKQQLNGDVFLNSVTWLSQDDRQPLSIRPKQPKNRRLNLTIPQAIVLKWASLLVLPLFAFICAVIVWWKRR